MELAYDPQVGSRSRRLVAILALVTGTSLAVVATALSGGLDGAATASEVAERGSRFQATDTVPLPTGCRRVVVIGDSLMDNAEPWLRAELRSAGHDYVVDAQPSRRTPGSWHAPYSGVKAARAVRSTFGESDCWVVALGSNDLYNSAGAHEHVFAGMVAEMVAAVTPGARVWWVNVNYRRDPRTSFDFVTATRTFNAVVDARAAEDEAFQVIDWYTLSEANPQWFFDPVHVDRAASIVRAEFTVAALPPPAR